MTGKRKFDLVFLKGKKTRKKHDEVDAESDGDVKMDNVGQLEKDVEAAREAL